MEKKNVTKKEIEEFVEKFIDIIGYAVEVKILEIGDCLYSVDFEGENLGALIGFHGKNIGSVENLINLMIARKMGIGKYVVIDINGYRKSRLDVIKKYTVNAINNVSKNHNPYDLYPMSAYERSFVHNLAKEFENIETVSSGEEPNRFITIKFKEND